MSFSKLKLFVLIIITAIVISLAAISHAETEQELAKSFMNEVRANFSIIDDPLIQDYIQKLGQRLVVHADSQYKIFHFFIVDDNTINAFSGPNGNIGINSGIFLATNSESELASVLAHEISHVTQKHIARLGTEEKGLIIPKIATTAAIVAAGMVSKSNSSANMTAGAVLTGMAGSSQYEINSVRSFEREADRIGIKLLYLSGFDPLAMPEFFERVENYSLNTVGDVPALLIDHPVTAERIADARNRAMSYQKHQIITDPNYYLIKTRLKVLTSENDYRIDDYFKKRLEDGSEASREAAEYGYALILLKTAQFSEAHQIINKLLRKYPDNLIYALALAEIKTEENKNEDAVVISRKLLAKNADSYAAIVTYASNLIAAKHYRLAENFLTAQTENYPNDPTIFDLLTLAQGKNGHLKNAYRTRAKLFGLFGYDKAAAIQLEQARKY